MRALPCLLLLLCTSSSLSFLLSPPSASSLHVCPSFPYCFLERRTGLWAPLSLQHLLAPTYQASPVSMLHQSVASLPSRALTVAAASPRDSTPCWLPDTYCTARPSNTLATRGEVDTAALCQEECAKEQGCTYFTFTRRRGKNRCSLLSECTISARCQVGPNCVSGRPNCSCPQIKKDTTEDPDTRYARWSCGSVDPYTSAVPTGTVCKTTCPAWRNKGLESTCQPDGQWSSTTPTATASSSRLAPLILPYTVYATPDQPDMVCGCKDVGPFDYDPTAEDGAEVVCRDSDPPKFSSGQGWNFTTTNYCTLFCNKEAVVDVYCQGSRWQGEPERGLWCYTQPENPAPGKISGASPPAAAKPAGVFKLHSDASFDYYKIAMNSGVTMVEGATVTTCRKFDMESACYGPSGCKWNDESQCQVVPIETGCEGTMQGLSQAVCDGDKYAYKCAELDGVFQYMKGWYGSDQGLVGGDGGMNGQYFTSGEGGKTLFAYCVQAL